MGLFEKLLGQVLGSAIDTAISYNRQQDDGFMNEKQMELNIQRETLLALGSNKQMANPGQSRAVEAILNAGAIYIIGIFKAPESFGSVFSADFAANGFKQNNLRHSRGVLSMARSSSPNSAGSQFFIMHQDAKHLDGQYAAFGKVLTGMEVVDAICAAAKPTDDNGSIPWDARPVMTSVTIRTENAE